MKNEFLKNPMGTMSHSHSSSIVEHNGELYIAWYVYEEKENEKGQVVFSKYDNLKQEWGKSDFAFPSLLGTSQGNPVLFSSGNQLHMFFVILKRHYWNSSEIYVSSYDAKLVKWSNPEKVNTPEGMMVRHRPMVLGNHLIVPAYDEHTMSTILYSISAPFSNWSEYSRIPGRSIQGDLISFNHQECQMYLRATDDLRKVMKTVSHDAGKNWDIVRQTKLHCPLSGIAAISLKSGTILLAHNHTENHKRHPLSLSLSDSKGVGFDLGTWHVDTTEIELSYPTLIQDQAGLIHLAFTFNRKMIKHISFTEAELMAHLGSV